MNCSRPKRWRKNQLQACCTWQRNIRANGWLKTSRSYRALFVHIADKCPHLCESSNG